MLGGYYILNKNNQINPLRTDFFSLPEKISGCLFSLQTASTLQWCGVFGKNVLLPTFLKRYKFVTMVHKGANFTTSLCFQSSLEAKFEGWEDSKYILNVKELVLLNF